MVKEHFDLKPDVCPCGGTTFEKTSEEPLRHQIFDIQPKANQEILIMWRLHTFRKKPLFVQQGLEETANLHAGDFPYFIKICPYVSIMVTTYFYEKKNPCPRRECLRAGAKIVNTAISLTDLRKRCLLWCLRNFGENSLSNREKTRAVD